MHKEIILSEQPPKNKTKQKVISNKAENGVFVFLYPYFFDSWPQGYNWEAEILLGFPLRRI